jgi:hypothetical protein
MKSIGFIGVTTPVEKTPGWLLTGCNRVVLRRKLSACFVVSAAYIHAETGAGHAPGWCEPVPAVAMTDNPG